MKRVVRFLNHLTRYLELKTGKMRAYNEKVELEIAEQKRRKPYVKPMFPYRVPSDWERTRIPNG